MLPQERLVADEEADAPSLAHLQDLLGPSPRDYKWVLRDGDSAAANDASRRFGRNAGDRPTRIGGPVTIRAPRAAETRQMKEIMDIVGEVSSVQLHWVLARYLLSA
jgi:hypothetical protein